MLFVILSCYMYQRYSWQWTNYRKFSWLRCHQKLWM